MRSSKTLPEEPSLKQVAGRVENARVVTLWSPCCRPTPQSNASLSVCDLRESWQDSCDCPTDGVTGGGHGQCSSELGDSTKSSLQHLVVGRVDGAFGDDARDLVRTPGSKAPCNVGSHADATSHLTVKGNVSSTVAPPEPAGGKLANRLDVPDEQRRYWVAMGAVDADPSTLRSPEGVDPLTVCMLGEEYNVGTRELRLNLDGEIEFAGDGPGDTRQRAGFCNPARLTQPPRNRDSKGEPETLVDKLGDVVVDLKLAVFAEGDDLSANGHAPDSPSAIDSTSGTTPAGAATAFCDPGVDCPASRDATSVTTCV